MGEVKVTKPVGSKGDKYKALVLRANSDILKGSQVSLNPLKNFSYKEPSDKPILSIKNLKILGGESVLNRKIFNDGDLIYLNRGKDDGIEIGDVYYVARSMRGFFNATEGKDIPGSSAFVKIIAADGRYATGVLYNMTNIISTGGRTRTKIY